MNYKSFNLGDWIGHISGVIEDETTLDGNEMRDLVEFLSTLEQEPCEDFKQKDGVVIEQLRADRDRLENALEVTRAEIDRQKEWLLHKTTYNVEIALDAIKSVAVESEEKE